MKPNLISRPLFVPVLPRKWLFCRHFSSGADRDRTGDLRLAKPIRVHPTTTVRSGVWVQDPPPPDDRRKPIAAFGRMQSPVRKSDPAA
jgi:hypothetical protein